ncbi:MAG TPA: glycoside hydrolase family 97 N-terminal domain-containing protein, partial [Lacipirellulaceae bacterium]|nr:glycoside hydrolase family 97 N-terminal domain-containing protein [Lacipirellulaceae bacterium]
MACLACMAHLAFGRTSAVAQEPAAVPPPATPMHVLRSPDETIEVSISIGAKLTYSVRVDGQQVLAPSRLGLKLRNGTTFGRDVELVNATHQSADSIWENPFG